MIQSTESLWQTFCQLRVRSRAYRAVDDPAVASAYNDWLAAHLAESEFPRASNIIQFPGARK